MTSISLTTLLTIFGTFIYALSFICIIQAIMQTRTAQGAVAWTVALLAVPFLTVPIFLVFGYRRFNGYKVGSKYVTTNFDKNDIDLFKSEFADRGVLYNTNNNDRRILGSSGGGYMTSNNEVKLLVNGEVAYKQLFGALLRAQKYIFIEYYIIRADKTGNLLKDILIQKAKGGVACYVIYDTVGARKFGDFTKEMREAGVKVAEFVTTKGLFNKFRLNFRNHRKIALVDGEIVFTGGINIGDDYLGEDKKLTPWRDTNVSIKGPSVTVFHYIFTKDWEFATGEELSHIENKVVLTKSGTQKVAPIATSPANLHEYGTLFFLHMLFSAKKRIWIFNPYFVPDEQFISALQLASMREVEVLIVTPEKSDGLLVKEIAIGSMYNFADFPNITWRQYTEGFMHQKVFLIDDDISIIGTHNFDNRSFRLNFEVSALVQDVGFAKEVENMLKQDLEKTKLADKKIFEEMPFWRRFTIRLMTLFAPVA